MLCQITHTNFIITQINLKSSKIPVCIYCAVQNHQGDFERRRPRADRVLEIHPHLRLVNLVESIINLTRAECAWSVRVSKSRFRTTSYDLTHLLYCYKWKFSF